MEGSYALKIVSLLPTGSSSSSKPAADPRFHFSGDAEDEEEEDAEEENGAAQGAAGDEEEDDEDDLSVAFSILDLTRVIYQKIVRSAEEQTPLSDTALETLSGDKWSLLKVKNELAEVLNDLGDVGLESGESSRPQQYTARSSLLTT